MQDFFLLEKSRPLRFTSFQTFALYIVSGILIWPSPNLIPENRAISFMGCFPQTNKAMINT